VRAGAVLLVCTASLLASATTIAPAQAASTAATGPAYVALGDSYAAGYGLQPSTGQPVPGCDQSAQDYPHQLAAALDLDLVDVTCGGAVTANITTTPENTGKGTAPPQDTALNGKTRIVTLTIGGNDLGFTDIATYCAAASAHGPLLTHPFEFDCRGHYTAPGSDNLHDKLDTTVSPAIAAVLAAIHTKAPRAKVFVLGYPAIAPDAADTPVGGCFRPTLGYPPPTEGYPFTSTDIPFLLQTEQSLDNAIQTDTLAAGDTFVPTLQASLAHTPCAASDIPAGTPWINGLSISSLTPPSLQPGALHPDAAGVAYLTAQLTAAIKATLPANSISTNPTAYHRLAPTLALAAVVAIAAAFLLLRRRTRRRAARH
jgi:lysophospholipase L1-like esterase